MRSFVTSRGCRVEGQQILVGIAVKDQLEQRAVVSVYQGKGVVCLGRSGGRGDLIPPERRPSSETQALNATIDLH